MKLLLANGQWRFSALMVVHYAIIIVLNCWDRLGIVGTDWAHNGVTNCLSAAVSRFGTELVAASVTLCFIFHYGE